MPPEKTQSSLSTGPLNRMFAEMDRVLATSVKEEDFVKFSKMLIDTINAVERRLSERMAQTKGETASNLTALRENVSAVEARLTARFSEQSSKQSQDLADATQRLYEKVKEVEEMIMYYDDSEVRNMIETVRKDIPTVPEAFNPAEILNELETLHARYKELEDKIIMSNKGGGGVTNLRIQQAFKYILKTEAPVGALNGVNTTYTVSQPIFAILGITLNGETIAQLPNYTIANKTITFSTALPAAYSGKDFEIKYI